MPNTRELREPMLDDDYPVFCGYLYVCDGRPLESPVSGCVRDLKRVFQASEVRRCDMVGRGMFEGAK